MPGATETTKRKTPTPPAIKSLPIAGRTTMLPRQSMPYRYILTHPGSAHKDDFLACCLLIAKHPVGIVRRDPSAEELSDASVAVVDIGDSHDPKLGNFDHHQFPREHPPTCSLSLILQHFGLYEDARRFCDWLEPAEWLDTRGPVETSRWLDIPRDTLAKLNSPIDVTLLRRFASHQELQAGAPLWEVMRWIGRDLIDYLVQLRQRLDFIAENAQVWTIEIPDDRFEVLFMPRTEPLPEEPSAALGRHIDQLGRPIVGMIYPDRRGAGYGLSRHQDHPRLDFTRIADCPDVHFAHARGFVAKTSANTPERLRQLMAAAWT